MKKLFLAVAMVLVLAGCSQGDPRAKAYEQLDLIKPCILDAVVYQSVEVGVTCAVDAVQERVSDELTDLLEGYLVDLPAEIELPLVDLFNVDSVRDVAVIIVEYIRAQFTFSFTIPGMAYAQDVPDLTPAPTLETDAYTWIQTAGLAFAMITITAFIRTNFLPKIGGLWVPLLALGVGLVIKYLIPLIPSNVFNDLVQLVIIAMSGGGTVDIYRKQGE